MNLSCCYWLPRSLAVGWLVGCQVRLHVCGVDGLRIIAVASLRGRIVPVPPVQVDAEPGDGVNNVPVGNCQRFPCNCLLAIAHRGGSQRSIDLRIHRTFVPYVTIVIFVQTPLAPPLGDVLLDALVARCCEARPPSSPLPWRTYPHCRHSQQPPKYTHHLNAKCKCSNPGHDVSVPSRRGLPDD